MTGQLFSLCLRWRSCFYALTDRVRSMAWATRSVCKMWPGGPRIRFNVIDCRLWLFSRRTAVNWIRDSIFISVSPTSRLTKVWFIDSIIANLFKPCKVKNNITWFSYSLFMFLQFVFLFIVLFFWWNFILYYKYKLLMIKFLLKNKLLFRPLSW